MSVCRILVINPNSNESVTRGIAEALETLRKPGKCEIVCTTLAGAPFGIETDEDIRTVMPMVVREIMSNNVDYDAFVIACYSDPGLAEARTVSKKPVFGIHESAAGLSASYGRRFGVLALGRESIQRHIAYIRRLGLQDFHAGERPLGISVDEAANDPETLGKIIETGRELVEQDGAETLILGCAGLAAHRQAAQEALGVPVIDPVQAAVTMAQQNFGC
ncbi:MAG: aspartate/glutamate racemase family protein [Gammaproteobacteria bacterium]|nr:aspartate/glutamate racemase family protein [Gammaproteobacteria bacterium]MDH4254541.1 aspartate/glutamate racemase family protein [Gammaproteobacteria bacterium]MDH5310391.1 aspartate/glutamate racemase family protein [Gammaproteobacteria bacterium]